MDKLASRLNKAVTRAGGGINNMIAAKALKELGWDQELASQIETLKRELSDANRRIRQLEAAFRKITEIEPEDFKADPKACAVFCIKMAALMLKVKDEPPAKV